MSERFADPQYFDKWKEPEKARPDGGLPFLDDDFMPEIILSEDAEEISHEDGDKVETLRYDTIDKNLLSKLRDLKAESLNNAKKATWERYFSSAPIVIRDMILSDKRTGEEINLVKLLPQDIKYYVLDNPTLEPLPEDTEGIKEMNSISKGLVTIEGNPFDLSTILSFLHEIGHRDDDKGEISTARRRLNRGYYLNQQEASQILLEERNAWAFALKTLRPFITDKNRCYIRDYVHKYALKSYSDNTLIAPDWLIKFGKWVEKMTHSEVK